MPVDLEKLEKLKNAVRTGGKGSVRRKKKAVHKTATTGEENNRPDCPNTPRGWDACTTRLLCQLLEGDALQCRRIWRGWRSWQGVMLCE